MVTVVKPRPLLEREISYYADTNTNEDFVTAADTHFDQLKNSFLLL